MPKEDCNPMKKRHKIAKRRAPEKCAKHLAQALPACGTPKIILPSTTVANVKRPMVNLKFP
jgi:hypothetical protein